MMFSGPPIDHWLRIAHVTPRSDFGEQLLYKDLFDRKIRQQSSNSLCKMLQNNGLKALRAVIFTDKYTLLK